MLWNTKNKYSALEEQYYSFCGIKTHTTFASDCD